MVGSGRAHLRVSCELFLLLLVVPVPALLFLRSRRCLLRGGILAAESPAAEDGVEAMAEPGAELPEAGIDLGDG